MEFARVVASLNLHTFIKLALLLTMNHCMLMPNNTILLLYYGYYSVIFSVSVCYTVDKTRHIG